MGRRLKVGLKLTAEEEAKNAGLRYVSSEVPGYSRRKSGKSFRYFDPKGRPVTAAKLKQRFQALVIPPAWQKVWISPDPRSHIQATGYDQKGRKQYSLPKS